MDIVVNHCNHMHPVNLMVRSGKHNVFAVRVVQSCHKRKWNCPVLGLLSVTSPLIYPTYPVPHHELPSSSDSCSNPGIVPGEIRRSPEKSPEVPQNNSDRNWMPGCPRLCGSSNVTTLSSRYKLRVQQGLILVRGRILMANLEAL